MIDLQEIIRQLNGNAEIIHTLMQTIPSEQAEWKPDPETWSMKEVMIHVYNEERIDFRKHLKEMLKEEFRHEEVLAVENCRQALEGFLVERKASVAWLAALDAPDWERVSTTPWGTIKAGDVLVAWVEHDILHLRQMVELLHAWNVKEAEPYSVQYAGGW